MNTQISDKISKIIDSMVASGMPRSQAVAVGMAIEHSVSCPSYAKEFGTFLQMALSDFVNTASAA